MRTVPSAAISADGLFSKPVTPSVDCADSFDATDIHPSRTIDTALLTIHTVVLDQLLPPPPVPSPPGTVCVSPGVKSVVTDTELAGTSVLTTTLYEEPEVLMMLNV